MGDDRKKTREPGLPPDGDQIRIDDDVIATIAGVAASDIDGVEGLSGGLASNMAEMLGWKDPGKGVRVRVEGTACALDIAIVVRFGARIPLVAHQVQERVRDAIETMTGLDVEAVNVHVQGITFPPDKGAGARR